jgi:hypothetical protein
MADALRRAGLLNDSGAPASGSKPDNSKSRRRDDRP